jgi:phospholipase/carboxylesterase
MKPDTDLRSSEAGLLYRLRRGQPQGGLIVMLHGLSGDENAMWIFDRALPRAAAVVTPRAPHASALGGYSWDRSAVRDEFDQVDFQEALERLARFVREASALYQANRQRVIVMGFSQGAALSYAFSLAHPELLRGVIALAGFLPDRSGAPPAVIQAASKALRDASQPSYLILHGTHDEAVPIERAREARLALAGRGASVEYHEHRVGHKVSAQGMQEIKRWIDKTLREF